MSYIGQVIEFKNDSAVIEIGVFSSCNKCSGCGGKSIFAGSSDKKRTIIAKTGNHSLLKGDFVEVSPKPGAQSMAALLVFGIPLFFFFIGLVFGTSILSMFIQIEAKDWINLLLGFQGLIMGFAVSFLIIKIAGFDFFMLQVERKISEEEIKNAGSCDLASR
ncbi:MAG: SoxR reducing system RseC family protein [Candidatus Riflebacteria bacterium]|nr:SoxR reducing system RseC family protein [Candidatus Riflebacteria bacterium]